MNVAVALRYDGPGDLPRVVAKGQGHIAAAIIEQAVEAGIPVEQDELLASALAQLELDQNIPPELYKAVAKVIAFLMRH